MCEKGIPLLAVLAHTHSSSVARRRVAAGALTDLEADAASGAAGGPGSPGCPGPVPEQRKCEKNLKVDPQRHMLHREDKRGFLVRV